METSKKAHVSSAWKAWTVGNRQKPETKVMSIAEFYQRVKDGTLQ